MVYFRTTGLVSSLGIRTVTSDGANDYEDSETVFHLGGPHEISVEMRNASEDELHQSNRRDLYLACRVTGKWEPDSQEVSDAFEALSEGRVPNSTESLEEVRREIAQGRTEGRISSGYSFPWDWLPSSSQVFISQVSSELGQAAQNAAEALRWRYGILGHPSPCSLRNSEWSFDAKQWHVLPTNVQLHVEIGDTKTVHLTEQGKADTEALLSEELVEPLGHVLFREAWMLRGTSPRSALVIGVAALEAGFKKFVAELVPEAEWLVEEAPTPPLADMLQKYLPQLPAKCKFEGEVLPPPKKLLKPIREAVKKRNRVVHRGSSAVGSEVLKEWLRAIRDVLWLLDYYRGLPWALEHVREETRKDMGL